MRLSSSILTCAVIVNLALAIATENANAQYVIPWTTIDGGGHTFSTGGPYSLGGTIGQPDAGAMIGGQFILQGGFWPAFDNAGTGVPAATVATASLRKTHAAIGPQDIAVNLAGTVASANVTSEPRSGGVTELRIAFDTAPGAPAGDPVALEEQTCIACPCTGTPGAYAPYSGSSVVSGVVAGNELVVTFTPGLENARTYRLTVSPEVTAIAGQTIEVRSLLGDANSDAKVNATDRSIVVGVWTSATPFSPATDINLNGATNATDRSMVVGAWTGPQNCAP